MDESHTHTYTHTYTYTLTLTHSSLPDQTQPFHNTKVAIVLGLIIASESFQVWGFPFSFYLI